MTGCKNCHWWKHADHVSRKFIGICGHRDHGGEMTDRTEGANCMDFEARDETPSVSKEGAPTWAA